MTIDRELLRGLLGEDELRSLDSVHDLLRRLGDLTSEELIARCVPDRTRALSWIRRLEEERRIVSVRIAGEERWIVVEDVARYRDGVGTAPPTGVPEKLLGSVERPLDGLVSRYARQHVPFASSEPARRWGLPVGPVEEALRRRAAAGSLILGGFRAEGTDREWCDPEVLRAVKRRSLARLRREVEPVSGDTLARFMPEWHGIGSGLGGVDRLIEVIGQLEGYPVPASVLERDILPARVARYQARLLDELCAAGEVVWLGRGRLGVSDGRIALYRRENVVHLLPRPNERPEGDLHDAIRGHLAQAGASFYRDIYLGTGGGSDAPMIEALWDLVWAGEVTNDTFAPLRALRYRRGRDRKRRRPPHLSKTGPPEVAGRWSLTASSDDRTADTTAQFHAVAGQLLDRYGIVTRDNVAGESVPGGFPAVYPVFKMLEESGKIRRGYFVNRAGGAQFAQPSAADRLRGERNTAERGRVLVLAATDPANPYGLSIGWPVADDRVRRGLQRVAGAHVVLVDGFASLYVKRGGGGGGGGVRDDARPIRR